MIIKREYSDADLVSFTEKLIAKRKKLGKEDFNSTSNEIGFDQKALRLRYGQYLGEEEENWSYQKLDETNRVANIIKRKIKINLIPIKISLT